MREIIRRTRGNEPILTVAAIWHDTGKLSTTEVTDTGITAHDHEYMSVEIFDRLGHLCHPHMTPLELQASRFIIKNHMRIKKFDEMRKNTQRKFIDECIDMDGIIKLSGGMFQNMILFSECDKMTIGPGVLHPNHLFALNDGVSKSLDRLLLSMRRNEIKETKRIELESEE